MLLLNVTDKYSKKKTGELGYKKFFSLGLVIVLAGFIFLQSLRIRGNQIPTESAEAATVNYSTLYGGKLTGAGTDIFVDGQGNEYYLQLFHNTPGDLDCNIRITKLKSRQKLWSKDWGGSKCDAPQEIIVDSEGYVYVIGNTESSDFPLKNPIQKSFAGGTNDVFLLKLNPTGGVVMSTFIGGSKYEDQGGQFFVNNGIVYIVGRTGSENFPLTPDAFQSTFGGGFDDAFLVKIDTKQFKLIYSTFIGGSDDDRAKAVTLDKYGNIIIVGETSSLNYPIYKPLYDHLWGGGDMFVTKMTPDGKKFIFSTYLGSEGYSEGAEAVAIDTNNRIIVVGSASGPNYPLVKPLQQYKGTSLLSDIAVSVFKATGDALLFSTLWGGSYSESAESVLIDSQGAIYLAGSTSSRDDFPLKNALQSKCYYSDVYFMKIKADYTAVDISTCWGGSGSEGLGGMAAISTAPNRVWISGSTNSGDFPLINPLDQTLIPYTSKLFYSKAFFAKFVLDTSTEPPY